MNRRQILAGAVLGLAFPAGVQAAAEDEPRLIAEDYAVARKHFSTRLVRRGPAPDPAQTNAPPQGAVRVDYRSDGLDLVAWMSPADVAKPRPGIMVLHGGNALWQGHWTDLARPYVDAGFVAMMPAVRGENGLPGAFSGFYDETADVLAATEVLRATPGVDPARLYLTGHSVGGTLAMLAALASPNFRAAAAFSGNPDASAFFKRFPEDVRFDAADPREFDMRSAACFAQSFKCPTLLLHGSAEKGSANATRLTVERARAKSLDVRSGIVEGSHMSAIPGEIAESLRFFAAV